MYRRVALVSLSAVACLSAAAVWISASGGAAGGVAVPSPSASAARMCGALHDALPRKVDGLSKRSVSPVSDLTAGWGILRWCCAAACHDPRC